MLEVIIQLSSVGLTHACPNNSFAAFIICMPDLTIYMYAKNYSIVSTV